MADGVPPESQVARRLAENGYHVIVPALIDRTVAARNGRAKLTNREFLYRSAFELGRHLIGYEVQKVLGLIDALKADRLDSRTKIAGLRLRRRRDDRALRGGSRPADRRGLRERLISAIGTMSGKSRSTATSSACSSNSAMPRSPV